MATEEPGEGSDGGRLGPMDLRVSDAERQQVVDALRGHTGAGRLQLDEFEERSGLAFAARTRRDLAALLVDLPSPGPWGTTTTGPRRVRDSVPGPVSPEWPSPGAGEPVRADRGHHRSHEHHRPRGPHRPHGRSSCAWYGGKSAWLYVGVLMTGIWAATGANIHDFWPFWVIGPWGLTFLFGRGRRSPQRRAIPTGDL